MSCTRTTHKIEKKNNHKQGFPKLNKRKKKKHHRKSRNISFPYQLFLYRQELRRAKVDFSYLRLSRAKIMLTGQLIDQNMNKDATLSSLDDLKMLSREVQFKKRLCNQVQSLEQFRELGLTDVVLNGKKTVL